MVIWETAGVKLVYTEIEPWPYNIEMEQEAESYCILSRYEIESLVAALTQHLLENPPDLNE